MCELQGGISEEQNIFWRQNRLQISQDVSVVTYSKLSVAASVMSGYLLLYLLP